MDCKGNYRAYLVEEGAERRGGLQLYDVKTEKKIPTITVKNGARRGTSSSLTISVGDMLKSVKNYNGGDYVDSNGVGNFC